MGNDGFVWMDDAERRRQTNRPSVDEDGSMAEAGPDHACGLEPSITRVLDEAWAPTPGEPTLSEIGTQLRLWMQAKVRRVRREAPRWALDRIAARLLA